MPIRSVVRTCCSCDFHANPLEDLKVLKLPTFVKFSNNGRQLVAVLLAFPEIAVRFEGEGGVIIMSGLDRCTWYAMQVLKCPKPRKHFGDCWFLNIANKSIPLSVVCAKRPHLEHHKNKLEFTHRACTMVGKPCGAPATATGQAAPARPARRAARAPSAEARAPPPGGQSARSSVASPTTTSSSAGDPDLAGGGALPDPPSPDDNEGAEEASPRESETARAAASASKSVKKRAKGASPGSRSGKRPSHHHNPDLSGCGAAGLDGDALPDPPSADGNEGAEASPRESETARAAASASKSAKKRAKGASPGSHGGKRPSHLDGDALPDPPSPDGNEGAEAAASASKSANKRAKGASPGNRGGKRRCASADERPESLFLEEEELDHTPVWNPNAETWVSYELGYFVMMYPDEAPTLLKIMRRFKSLYARPGCGNYNYECKMVHPTNREIIVTLTAPTMRNVPQYWREVQAFEATLTE